MLLRLARVEWGMVKNKPLIWNIYAVLDPLQLSSSRNLPAGQYRIIHEASISCGIWMPCRPGIFKRFGEYGSVTLSASRPISKP